MLRIDGTSGGTQVLDGLGVPIFPSGSTTLVQDNFNTAAAGTVLSGETPAIGPKPHQFFGADGTGEFVIETSPARAEAANADFPIDIYESLGQSDVSISATGTWGGSNDLTYILRIQDTSNYWSLTYDPGSQTLYLIETFGGSSTTRATQTVTGHSSGSYSFKAQTSGTNLSGNLDNGAGTVSYSSSDLQSAQNFGIACSFNFGAGGSTSDYYQSLLITHP